MREGSFQNLVAVNRLPHPLVVQLQRFTASLIEQSYAEETVRLKVKLVTNLVPMAETKPIRRGRPG